MRQIDAAEGCIGWSELEEFYDWGFGVFRNFAHVSHTALDVVEQFQHAKKNKWLSKGANEADYNNRWLQFAGEHIGKTKELVKQMKNHYNFTNAHVYANWIQDGHNYGRHTDKMDVIILQLWGETAYCCESVYGEKAHSSMTLKPGDAIFIRNGVWHTPIILGQRMSMSFSWV